MVTSRKKDNAGNPYNCPMTAAVSKIGGRWKPIILFYLSTGNKRFGKLAAIVPMISKKVLSQQLKELADDGLVVRKQYDEVPLRVDYSLTDFGRSVLPILDKICEWGKQFVDNSASMRDVV